MNRMKRHIILLFLLAFLIPGFAQQPDQNQQLIYPIPQNQGDPMQQLYTQSPLYLQDPTNFTHEV